VLSFGIGQGLGLPIQTLNPNLLNVYLYYIICPIRSDQLGSVTRL
jgi:hypothetical protein